MEHAITTVASATRSRIRIFSKNLEFLNLWLPFLVLIPVALHTFNFIHFSDSFVFDRQALLIRNVVFFNFTHGLLGFFLIHSLVEFKTSIESQFSGGLKEFYAKLALVIFVTLGTVFILSYKVFADAPIINLLFELYIPIFSMQHSLGQIRGLTACYDYEERLALKTAGRGEQIERLNVERITKKLYLGCLISVSMHIAAQKLLSVYPTYYSQIMRLKNLSMVMGLIFAAFCVGLSLWRTRGVPSNKWVYQLRLFLFPFLFSYPALLYFWGFCHGIESICMMQNIDENCKAKSKAIGSIFKFILIASLFYCVLLLLPLIVGVFKTNVAVVESLCWGLIVSCTMAHHFVDLYLYRMHTPQGRTEVAPLLRRVS